jgi:hypothetical protein
MHSCVPTWFCSVNEMNPKIYKIVEAYHRYVSFAMKYSLRSNQNIQQR